MATTIKTGAIYNVGVYGTDRYGTSNVLHIPDGVDVAALVGSFFITGTANVSVDGVSSSIVVEDVVVSGTATSSVSGVEVSFDNGNVVVLESEFVVLSGVAVTAYIDAVSVVTTAFPFVPEDYDAERVVYVEARTPAIQRFIYVEQQPRIVVVEEKETPYTRTSNIARQHRQTYINRGTTNEERTTLVEE